MFLKYIILAMSGVALCLMVMSAGAETANEKRQSVVMDQQALNDAYKQLREDRKAGNAAGVLIDQSNIAAAEQDFHVDTQHMIADDEDRLAADERALDGVRQQLQQDRITNVSAIASDEADMGAAQEKLQADSQRAIADDGIQVDRDTQALNNEKWQLQQDLKGSLYADYGPNTIQTDEANVKEAAVVLQEAQLKLQLDEVSLDQDDQPHLNVFRTVSSAAGDGR